MNMLKHCQCYSNWNIKHVYFILFLSALLCGHKVHDILSESFSQDPLENYFGQQRARGGRSDNPTVQESAQCLCIVGAGIHSLKG